MTSKAASALISILLSTLVLSACLNQAPAPLAEPVPETPSPAAPTPTTGIPAPEETAVSPTSLSPTPLSPDLQAAPRPHYSLSAVLDYGRHHLAVEQQIRYTNRSTEPLSELLLMVDPASYPGVFQLKSLTWEDGQAVDGTTWDGMHLKLPLRQPLGPGERIALSLDYELNLPSPEPSPTTRPVPFGYTQRQTNLVDWYPFIPPYVPGPGWIAHQPGYFGEHLAYEQADFEVEIRLADGPTYGGQPLTIAASAPAKPVEGERDAYRYRFEAARNFVWSVSHDYQVDSMLAGDVVITSYTFPLHAAAGEAVLNTTSRALELYSSLFGPYPHETLAVVEADFLDGMEYDGLYFLSNGFYNLYQGTPGEYLIAIAAHETAHQWWYGLVGNDQAAEPWLDEALCTYSERLYYESLHPEALDWWWAYRVNYYQPRGWVDGSIYNPEGYRAYRDAVYLNGAVFLEELRQQVGDQVFLTFLKDYAEKNAGALATGDTFFDLLAQHTSTDLNSLLERYFQNHANW